MKQPRKIKPGIRYAIPCCRADGTQDEITIEVIKSEECGSKDIRKHAQKGNIILINNRYMGAHVEKIDYGRYCITNKKIV